MLTLGNVGEAVEHAERSVTYADRSGDAFYRVGTRTTHADALQQAGRWNEAAARFRHAEQMQAKHQPTYALLYSLQGFRYCELLLAKAEREAGKAAEEMKQDVLLAQCRTVSERAALTLKWAEHDNVSVLSIALDHLTMGRAAPYAAILESRSCPGESESAPPTYEVSQHVRMFVAKEELDSAVSELRRSGDMDGLPRGLLSSMRPGTAEAFGPVPTSPKRSGCCTHVSCAVVKRE